MLSIILCRLFCLLNVIESVQIANIKGARSFIVYGRKSCLHSLTLFLRHHNRVNLWWVFSMRLVHYFLPKGAMLALVGNVGRCLCDHGIRVRPRSRGTLLLVIEHSINKLHLRLSCSNKRNRETERYRRKP